jgi:PKHD-type hydroxylase
MMIAPIPPRTHTVEAPVAYWDSFLTQQDVDTILSLPQWHDCEPGQIGKTNDGIIDTNIRNSGIVWFTPCEKTNHIWLKITNAIAEVNNQFFHFDLKGCYEPAQLSIYRAKDKEHYGWHVDHGMDTLTPRKLSMSLLLSDTNEFKGGELEVKTINDDPLTLDQRQGRAWFFPSYTLHRVTPVTKGVRRSLVLWVGGPPFK